MGDVIYGPDGKQVVKQLMVTTDNLRKIVNDFMRQAQAPKAVDLLAATLARVGQVAMEQQLKIAALEKRLDEIATPSARGN